jgi:hypothetical protein
MFNPARLDIIHIPGDRHIQDQRALPQEGNIINNALSQIGKGKKRHMIDVFF